MKIFKSNPYRILGIKANATPNEKEKAKNTISAFLKIGKDPLLSFDICPPLDQIERTSELIEIKSNEILNDSKKIINAIFWFISGGAIDDIVLNSLTNSKDTNKAIETFEKASNNFLFTENSICSIVNHSTLELICFSLHKDRRRLKSALNNKLNIACSKENTTLLSKFLNVDVSKINFSEIENEVFIISKNIILELYPSEQENDLIAEFFSGQKSIYDKYIQNRVTKKIQLVKEKSLKAKNDRDDLLQKYFNQSCTSSYLLNNSARIGNSLLENTVDILLEIKASLGSDHASTTMAYESVLDELNFCGVLPFNALMENITNSNDTKKREILDLLKPEDFDGIISFTGQGISKLGDVNTTVISTLKDNLNAYNSMKIALKNAKEGGGGSNDFGCLGDIIGRLVGYAVLLGLFALLARACD